MIDWKKLAGSASNLVKQRGGTKSVMEDAGELTDIAKGSGSLSDKAKQAAEALKEPGAHHEGASAPPDEQAQADEGGTR